MKYIVAIIPKNMNNIRLSSKKKIVLTSKKLKSNKEI